MAELYFDEKIETLPRDQLRKLQDHRLRWQFKRCWDGSAWYRARFEAAGLLPETFGGLADLEQLPSLLIGELRAINSDDWRVAPAEWATMRNMANGAVPRYLTGGDFTHQEDRSARSRWAAGIPAPSDLSVVAPGELLLRAGGFRRMGPPESAIARRIPLGDLHIELVGPCVAHACVELFGQHWLGDQLLAELIDPESAVPVSAGQPGELVVTDLVREASPLIRYRTGLRARLVPGQCACGRTSAKIALIRP